MFLNFEDFRELSKDKTKAMNCFKKLWKNGEIKHMPLGWETGIVTCEKLEENKKQSVNDVTLTYRANGIIQAANEEIGLIHIKQTQHEDEYYTNNGTVDYNNRFSIKNFFQIQLYMDLYGVNHAIYFVYHSDMIWWTVKLEKVDVIPILRKYMKQDTTVNDLLESLVDNKEFLREGEELIKNLYIA